MNSFGSICSSIINNSQIIPSDIITAGGGGGQIF